MCRTTFLLSTRSGQHARWRRFPRAGVRGFGGGEVWWHSHCFCHSTLQAPWRTNVPKTTPKCAYLQTQPFSFSHATNMLPKRDQHEATPETQPARSHCHQHVLKHDPKLQPFQRLGQLFGGDLPHTPGAEAIFDHVMSSNQN